MTRRRGDLVKLDELSPEIEKKARECKSPEELLALVKEEDIELGDEQLDEISGGLGEDTWSYCPYCDKKIYYYNKPDCCPDCSGPLKY